MARKEEKKTHPDASRTIVECCDLENIPRVSFYQMRRNGFGPEDLRVPGSDLVRITKDAHERWRERMQELATTKQAKLENERRVALRRTAGKRSAALAKRGERAA